MTNTRQDCLQKRIGIIGGGQLGKMMILEAKRLGVYVVTLDPAPDCPSASISDELIAAGFYDRQAIFSLAQRSDVITYEYEHIDSDTLEQLERDGHTVYPSAASLKCIQDKFLQKTKLAENGLTVPAFTAIRDLDDMRKFAGEYGYPFMLKSRKDGYDGKGNFLVRDEGELERGYNALGGADQPLMAEEFVDFAMEVSVIATRGADGSKVVYPVAQNVHKNSILDRTTVPADLSEKLRIDISDVSARVMDVFDGVGTFCVEMFAGKNGDIYINEVAPRPHNSGHYTIEGCRVNQFENHIRAVLGLPLGDTSLLHPAVVMRNLIGRSDGPATVHGLEKAYMQKGVNLHIYGKAQSKTHRKMGHYTITADSLSQANDIDGKLAGKVWVTAIDS